MTQIYQEIFKNIRRLEITSKKLAKEMMIGAYHSAFKGKGMEFEEVREYIEGDDIRSIDWNVTARMNHAYVKSFREERELPVMLLIDVSGSTNFGSHSHLKKTLIAEVAALLAFTAIKNNDHIGLLLFSDKVEKYIPPKRGIRHVLRLIRDLLMFVPERKLTDLKPSLDYFGKVQKKRSICFLISDFLFSFPKEEVARIAKFHDLISIYVSDKYDVLPDMGLIYCRDLETDQFKYMDTSNKKIRQKLLDQQLNQKEEFKKNMHKIGVDYLFLETDQSYEKELRKFFKKRRLKLSH